MNSKHSHAFGFAFVALPVLLAWSACATTPQNGGDASAHTTNAEKHVDDAPKITPAQASQRLKEGNARFSSGYGQHPRQNERTRAELAHTQHPFAVILGCADSRTSPEILFDQGLGDLFVVREAGNVIDDHTLGSIEYAAEHLHAPLIVVLGHERCGAVAAARDTVLAKGHATGHIDSLVDALRPAVEHTAGLDAEATCKVNIHNVVAALKVSEPLLHQLVYKGELEIVGAYYDLDTGIVTFLTD